MADKAQTAPNRLKRTTSRVPAPNRWPAWVHFLVMLAIFVAGIQAGIFWMSAPWVLLVFVAIVAVTLYLLWSK